jgi:orotidine-5'-phosphate decarboxylase
MPQIAIAFDVTTLADALELDQRLGPGPELAKIGLQLYGAAGPAAIRALRERGRRVFLDLKLHDIPNTVRGAAAAASRLGPDLLTVHAMGGADMIAAAVDGARSAGPTEIVAVTLLTSLDPERLPPGFARPFDHHRVLAELLATSVGAGAKGIVCSASDLAGIRAHHPEPFYAVTPGIRPATHTGGDDQKRVATVAEAVREGASLLVIGRPVTGAANPARTLEALRAECQAATLAKA